MFRSHIYSRGNSRNSRLCSQSPAGTVQYCRVRSTTSNCIRSISRLRGALRSAGGSCRYTRLTLPIVNFAAFASASYAAFSTRHSQYAVPPRQPSKWRSVFIAAHNAAAALHIIIQRLWHHHGLLDLQTDFRDQKKILVQLTLRVAQLCKDCAAVQLVPRRLDHRIRSIFQ